MFGYNVEKFHFDCNFLLTKIYMQVLHLKKKISNCYFCYKVTGANVISLNVIISVFYLQDLTVREV